MSSFSPGRAVLIGSPPIGTGSPAEISAGTQAQDSPVAQTGMWVNSELFYFQPLLAAVQRARTPSGPGIGLGWNGGIGALAGIWTPAGGKRFRLMAFSIVVTSNAIVGAAGIVQFQLCDGPGNVINESYPVFVPAAAGPVGAPLLLVVKTLPGNGYLSTTANNALRLEATVALTGGNMGAMAMGTEE